MPPTYFSPHLDVEHRDCRTCRCSIGRPDSFHLWCERHRLVVVFPCGWWERAVGSPGDGFGVTKSLHRIEESSLVKEVEAVGFRVVATGDFLRRPEAKRDVIVFSAPTLVDEFVLRFQKPK